MPILDFLTGTPVVAPSYVGRDQFTGSNGTQIAVHPPDVGGDWFGRGAYAGVIDSNEYKPGCCSGDVKFTRHQIGVYDRYHARALITRESTNPGGGGETQGIIVRANIGTVGNSDTNQHSVFYYFNMNDDSTVVLKWSQRTSGAGGTVINQVAIPGTVAWARGADRTLDVWVEGSVLSFGVDGAVVTTSGVLGTSWNDSDHSYAGIISADYANGRWDDWEVFEGYPSGATLVDIYGEDGGSLAGQIKPGDWIELTQETGTPKHYFSLGAPVSPVSNRFDDLLLVEAIAERISPYTAISLFRPWTVDQSTLAYTTTVGVNPVVQSLTVANDATPAGVVVGDFDCTIVVTGGSGSYNVAVTPLVSALAGGETYSATLTLTSGVDDSPLTVQLTVAIPRDPYSGSPQNSACELDPAVNAACEGNPVVNASCEADPVQNPTGE